MTVGGESWTPRVRSPLSSPISPPPSRLPAAAVLARLPASSPRPRNRISTPIPFTLPLSRFPSLSLSADPPPRRRSRLSVQHSIHPNLAAAPAPLSRSTPAPRGRTYRSSRTTQPGSAFDDVEVLRGRTRGDLHRLQRYDFAGEAKDDLQHVVSQDLVLGRRGMLVHAGAVQELGGGETARDGKPFRMLPFRSTRDGAACRRSLRLVDDMLQEAKELDTSPARGRHIPKCPQKVLDAPEMADDFLSEPDGPGDGKHTGNGPRF